MTACPNSHLKPLMFTKNIIQSKNIYDIYWSPEIQSVYVLKFEGQNTFIELKQLFRVSRSSFYISHICNTVDEFIDLIIFAAPLSLNFTTLKY